MLIVISGISGSGKTTIGRALVKYFNSFKGANDEAYKFVDEDSFYLKNKPKVKLSNGLVVANWDTLEAIDINSLRLTIESSENIVLVGFTLTKEIIGEYKSIHFHLSIGDTDEVVIRRCVEARKRSKGFRGDKAKIDELVVREVVMPFYKRTLKESDIDFKIDIYDHDKRRSVSEIVEVIMSLL